MKIIALAGIWTQNFPSNKGDNYNEAYTYYKMWGQILAKANFFIEYSLI